MYNKLFRVTFLLLSALLIQSCGFKPLNAVDGIDLQTISISQTKYTGVSKALSWELNKTLEMELLNGKKAAEPKYKLDTTLTALKESGMIQRDTTTSRYTVKMRLDYVLTDIASNNIIAKGAINLADSFDSSYSPFSNYISDESSKRLLLQNLASNLRHRMHMVKK